MTSWTSIKKYFRELSIATLGSALGAVLAAILVAMNWITVKSILAGVGAWLASIGAWLMHTTEVYNVALLADFLVLAALLAWVALWWYRSRASSAAESVPKVAQPCIPANFNPTLPQRAITVVLMQRWQKQSDLQCVADLVEQVKPGLVPKVLARAHIARDLELLETANVVSIDRRGLHDAYYHLTSLGRNWIIQRMEATKDKAATGE
jgi:hypothetical protein